MVIRLSKILPILVNKWRGIPTHQNMQYLAIVCKVIRVSKTSTSFDVDSFYVSVIHMHLLLVKILGCFELGTCQTYSQICKAENVRDMVADVLQVRRRREKE